MVFEKIPKWVFRILQIALIITILLYPVFMCCMTAYGWQLHAESYGAVFQTYAKAVYLGAFFMIISMMLALWKKNRRAVLLGFFGFLDIIYVAVKAVNIAKENYWSSQTEQGFGLMASDLWSRRMYPVIAPFLILCLLCFLQYFSYDAVEQRQKKKEQKRREENAPAPSIISEEKKS